MEFEKNKKRKRKRTNTAADSAAGVKPRTRKKRRGKRNLYWFTVFFFVVMVAFILCRTVFFKIEKIIVSGNSPYTAADISGVYIKKNTNLFGLDLKQTQKNIKNGLKYAERVSVKRRIPDGVVININAPEITASVGPENGRILISGKGRTLETYYTGDAVFYDGLEYGEFISGQPSDAQKDLLERFNEIYRTLKANGILEKTDSIFINNSVQTGFIYDGRLKVNLGNGGDLGKKGAFCAQFIKNHLGGDEVGVLEAKNTDREYFNPGEWRE